ncbi:MAG: hypothetical protein KKH52_00645 [Nanoarchaeota archaeon]|nr:hypothetical protein [Nanoarchaeota archaeon]MBU1623032.1 hypothetical protein [Nanoarchaeota archaeon]MBU1973884.1 hypothetical protein [Nanoarchaeota archaeon]
MIKTKKIALRLDRFECDQMKQDAKLKGHSGISDYLRTLAKQEKGMQEKIAEMHILVKRLVQQQEVK